MAVSLDSVGLIGAKSLVGRCLLQRLEGNSRHVVAFTRGDLCSSSHQVTWRHLEINVDGLQETIQHWICVAPVWVLPDYFELLEKCGARQLIVLSSTSAITKQNSNDDEERRLAQRLLSAEGSIIAWAEKNAVKWVVFRPTLIYGLGLDKNISEIYRVISLIGFFPLMGNASGLRQPIHAEDVATACISALISPQCATGIYAISGGETLSYQEMVGRVFDTLGRSRRMLRLPRGLLAPMLKLISCLPKFRHWTVGMVDRMERDLVFDHAEATRDFGFNPRTFVLTRRDLPG